MIGSKAEILCFAILKREPKSRVRIHHCLFRCHFFLLHSKKIKTCTRDCLALFRTIFNSTFRNRPRTLGIQYRRVSHRF